jgi:TldD protein
MSLRIGQSVQEMSKRADTKSEILGDLQRAVKMIRLPYSDGLYDSQTDLRISKNKDRETISARSIKGISLRGITANGWMYTNINRTDRSSIPKLVRNLNKRRKGKSANLTQPKPIKLDKKTPVKIDPQTIPLENKLNRIREIFQLARNMNPKVVDVRVDYSENLMERILCTSGGTQARQVIPRTRVGVTVVVKEDGVADSDLLRTGGGVGYEVVDALTEADIRGVVESAVEQLRAIPPSPGTHTVLLDPGVVGTVCHESFGHGLEADQAIRGRSYLKDMLGKKVASELVTIYEDPSYEGGHGTYYFDDDGVLSTRNTLVENGTLVSFLHDMESAAAMSAPLTGNSRTQNATRRRFIRMSNTYAKPGDRSLEDIISDTKHAILMMHWRSGMEDPLGGGMQVIAGKGYLIENGEKTTPLKSMTMTGRVLEVLAQVDAVSKEGFVVSSGNCGKGPEDFVPNGAGGTWWRTKAVIG